MKNRGSTALFREKVGKFNTPQGRITYPTKREKENHRQKKSAVDCRGYDSFQDGQAPSNASYFLKGELVVQPGSVGTLPIIE